MYIVLSHAHTAYGIKNVYQKFQEYEVIVANRPAFSGTHTHMRHVTQCTPGSESVPHFKKANTIVYKRTAVFLIRNDMAAIEKFLQ